MPWSRISFTGGYDSPDCVWLRTVFQTLYERASDDEYDALVLYRARKSDGGVTLYLSPVATARLTAPASHFDLVNCGRPEAEDVEVINGPPIAWDPTFCDLTSAERATIRDNAVWAFLEDAGYYENPDSFAEESFVDINGPAFRSRHAAQ